MSYKKLGQFIQPVNNRNNALKIERLLGVSIRKVLMPSIANTVGTNMKTYKIIKKNQFAYGSVTSRNGDKISIALLEEFDEAIVSQAYTVFEVIDIEKLNPEYLMMWFRRPEFDRYARFKSHGSARETFDWDELCDIELPIPSIEKQQEIVREYNTVVNRIELNETLNEKLEETAKALYKYWFVSDETYIDIETTLKDYIESANTGLDAIKRAPIVAEDTGVKCLRIQDVSRSKRYDNWGFTKVEEINYDKFQLKKNDIIIARTGATVGVNIFIQKDLKSVFNNGLIRIRADENKIYPSLLHLIFKTKSFIDHVEQISFGTSTQPNMQIGELLSFSFSLPPLKEQKKVIEYFHTLDKEKLNNEEQNNALEKINNLLLSRMTKVEVEKEII
jgi:type I restriction enzyme S subunit